MKKLNKTTLFLILTFVISYSLAAGYWIFGGRLTDRLAFMLMGAAYMFIPTLSVVIVQKFIYKEEIKRDLLISFKINKWFFFAWLCMPVITLVTIGVSLLFPGVTYNPQLTGMISRLEPVVSPEQLEQMKEAMKDLPSYSVYLVLLEGMIAGITVNALASFGEELGWRGFLLKSFQNLSFVKASMIIGLIWGIWHAPLILMGHNYPQHPRVGVLMMIVLCMLLTPMLLYVTIKAKSVLAAAIMHGTMNAIVAISIITLEGGNDLTVGIAGLAGFITIALFLTAIFVYDQYISKDKIMTNKIKHRLEPQA